MASADSFDDEIDLEALFERDEEDEKCRDSSWNNMNTSSSDNNLHGASASFPISMEQLEASLSSVVIEESPAAESNCLESGESAVTSDGHSDESDMSKARDDDTMKFSGNYNTMAMGTPSNRPAATQQQPHYSSNIGLSLLQNAGFSTSMASSGQNVSPQPQDSHVPHHHHHDKAGDAQSYVSHDISSSSGCSDADATPPLTNSRVNKSSKRHTLENGNACYARKDSGTESTEELDQTTGSMKSDDDEYDANPSNLSLLQNNKEKPDTVNSEQLIASLAAIPRVPGSLVPGFPSTIHDCNGKTFPPLRPLNAYNYYFREERDRLLYGEQSSIHHMTLAERRRKMLWDHWSRDRTQSRPHRKSHGKISFKELTSHISQGWKALRKEELTFYKQVAALDSKRFQMETKEYTKTLPSSADI